MDRSPTLEELVWAMRNRNTTNSEIREKVNEILEADHYGKGREGKRNER